PRIKRQEPISKMDQKALFDAAKGPDFQRFNDLLQQALSRQQRRTWDFLERVKSPSGNSLLHVAAESGRIDNTEQLCARAPFLIERRNYNGDTPLHSAVKAGRLETTKTLLRWRPNTGEETNQLVRIKNDMGNTALHDAVIEKRRDIVERLVSADPEVSYYSNKAGKSPLYLVVEARDAKTLTLLFNVIRSTGDTSPRVEGLNPVFLAIERKDIGILRQIENEMPKLLRVKDDKRGNNALHFASSKGYREGGHLSVVKLFIEEWSDDAKEYLTMKRQNILHVAAEYGQLNVVRYVLKEPYLASLIGGKDEDGNTPLHLAAKFCNPTIAFALVHDKRVDPTWVNNANLTAFDYPDVDGKDAHAVLKLRFYIYFNYFSFCFSTTAAVLLTIAHLNDFKFGLAIWVAFRFVGLSLAFLGLALGMAVELAAEKHGVPLPIRLTLEVAAMFAFVFLVVQWFEPESAGLAG
ncbi:hypothetical protein Tsubulata_041538, partial [Turnera subulata]